MSNLSKLPDLYSSVCCWLVPACTYSENMRKSQVQLKLLRSRTHVWPAEDSQLSFPWNCPLSCMLCFAVALSTAVVSAESHALLPQEIPSFLLLAGDCATLWRFDLSYDLVWFLPQLRQILLPRWVRCRAMLQRWFVNVFRMVDLFGFDLRWCLSAFVRCGRFRWLLLRWLLHPEEIFDFKALDLNWKT